MESYKASFDIRDRLAKADPENATWQHDLSGLHNRIGDLQQAQGNLPAAMESYKACFNILDRLAKADAANAIWQRDLALSHGYIAMIDARLGNRTRALRAFREGRAIITRLKERSPDIVTLTDDLTWFNRQIDAVK